MNIQNNKQRNKQISKHTLNTKNTIFKNYKNNKAQNGSSRGTTSGIEVIADCGKIHCLTIAGEIEGHTLSPQNAKTTKYEQVIPDLVRIEEDDSIQGLLLILNTIGGDVEAGLAISELIAGMKKPTSSLVLGGGHSIGVPLAVSADKSFIVPSGAMTVHPIRMSGTAITAPQTFTQMQRLQDRVIDFVTRHAQIDKNSLKKIMLDTEKISNDIGTVLYGTEAVDAGLIDQVGGLSDALDFINNKTKNKI